MINVPFHSFQKIFLQGLSSTFFIFDNVLSMCMCVFSLKKNDFRLKITIIVKKRENYALATAQNISETEDGKASSRIIESSKIKFF